MEGTGKRAMTRESKQPERLGFDNITERRNRSQSSDDDNAIAKSLPAKETSLETGIVHTGQNGTEPDSLQIRIPIGAFNKALSERSRQSSSATVKKAEVDILASKELDPLDEEEDKLKANLELLKLKVVDAFNIRKFIERRVQEYQTANNEEMVAVKKEELKEAEEDEHDKNQKYQLLKIETELKIKDLGRKRKRIIQKYELDKNKIDLLDEAKSQDLDGESEHSKKSASIVDWMSKNSEFLDNTQGLDDNQEKELEVVLEQAVEAARKAKDQLTQFEENQRKQVEEMEQKRLQLMKEVEVTTATVSARKIAKPTNPRTDPTSTEFLMNKLLQMQINMMENGSNAPRTTNSHFLARQSHAKDLPFFGGHPEQWPTFIAEFERSSKDCAFSNSENMSRLRKCLKGEALKTVQCLMVTPENLPEILKILKDRFGQPDHIIAAMIQRAKAVPAIKEDRLETLIEFGTAVKNVKVSVKALNREDHLNNPQLLTELEAKLPVSYKMNWMRWLDDKLERVKNVEFFSEWLDKETAIACRLCPPKIEAEERKRPIEQLGRRRPNPNVFAVADNKVIKDKGQQNPTKKWNPKEQTCAFCSDIGHRVAQCKEFAKIDPDKKWDSVKDKNLCFGCLIYGHDIKACRTKKTCGIDECKHKHHILLHRPKTSNLYHEQETHEEGTPTEVDSRSVAYAASSETDFQNCHILPVRLQGPKGIVSTFAMLDNGANVTLISTSIAEKLGLKGPVRPLKFKGLHPIAEEPDSKCVALRIMPYSGNEVYEMRNVRTIKSLPLPQQSINLRSIRKWKHLKGLGIEAYDKAQPTILIGNDHLKIMVVREVREGPPNAPVAVRTNLGWTILSQGDLPSKTHHTFLCQKEEDLHQIVKDYFTTENFGVRITAEQPRSKEDKRAQMLMDGTMKRVGPDQKRWETGLLWKADNIHFPDSKFTALNRLKTVERKLDRNPEYASQYYVKMQHYIDKGYARKLTTEEANTVGPRTWYLPHFGTSKPSKPDKIRLVFDAAAKSHGICLNDGLLKGSDQVNPLPSVLYKFRQRKVGITGDIREMFHQVNIRKEDQDSLRFLWRGSERIQEPEVYEMQVMVFGAACSPACAQEAKNRNAREHLELFPKAANAIIFKHFVDDYLDSLDSEEEAIQMIKDVVHTHLQGGFEIVNFISNSREVMNALPEEIKAEEPKQIDPESERMERVLGLNWDPINDQFTFTTNFYRVDKKIIDGSQIPTKREALSLIMSIYDPLGFLSHLTIKARILLQETWRSEIGWDSKIPPSSREKWIRFIEELQNISSFRLQRCYDVDFFRSTSVQLHVFCDASEQAYSAVAYFRIVTTSRVKIAFVSSKARVAPLKPLCMPRMELQAALLGVRLANTIKEQHERQIPETHYWTDSEVVYCWVRSDGKKCPQFVSHRIGEIQESSDGKDWHWIPTKENVADEATRDNCSTLWGPASRWIKGPAFLQLSEEHWPKKSTKEVFENVDETKLEFKKAFVGVIRREDPPIEVTRFSSWNRLRRSVAWIFRFKSNIRIKKEPERVLIPVNEVNSLTYPEIQSAEQWLIIQAQYSQFPEEIAKLKEGVPLTKASKLWIYDPTIDENGVLRVQGRLDKAKNVSKNVKNAMILDYRGYLTQLIIKYHHEMAGHHGQERIVNELRQMYCILNIRTAVRSAWNNCQDCKNRRAIPVIPQMGLIPECRLQSYVRPFTTTGLDYFGPIEVTVGRRHEKRYGALFTCMTSRAVHVEIAQSLTTDSCIMAIRRFAARRGNPVKLYSDNGTNFKGADNELKAALKEIDEKRIQEEMSNLGIQWHFIPPAAPNMGGCWERLVKSIKVALKSTLKSRYPKDELLLTLMAEAEHVVNSRPLTHVSIDPYDKEALTPNHFLLGCSSNMQPPGNFTERDVCLRNQWRAAEALTNQFWKRWVKEYLPTLTRRTKWHQTSRPVQVDDIVLIADNNMTRNSWPMGKIVAVYPGRDGQIRVADIKTANNHIYTRPVSKICVLDVRKIDENAAASSSGASMSASICTEP